MYGKPPPSLHHYLPGETKVAEVANALLHRDEMLGQLKFNLQQAQTSMIQQANRKRREVEVEYKYWGYGLSQINTNFHSILQ